MNTISLSDYYSKCTLCPLKCKVDRTNNKVGICGQTDQLKVAWVGLHKGEEPPISGTNGSGTIFFSGCSLQCPLCQNIQISNSKNPVGKNISPNELVDLFFELQDSGATNINLVTANHFIPSVVKALQLAKEKGLHLPVVYNSSGYEDLNSFKLIEPFIDTFLIDLKTLNKDVAKKFCNKEDYPIYALELLDYLYTNQSKTTIVRHLLFPEELEATKEVLRYFGQNYRKKFLLSLMVQFISPVDKVQSGVSDDTYQQLIDLLEELEIEEGFIQEVGDESMWLPDFTKENPFPKEFAKTIKSFN